MKRQSTTRAAVLMAVALGVAGQQIVGSRAGLVSFIEGAASLDAKRASHGRYWQVKDGETLRTSNGLVEVQISAGGSVRLARDSGLQMIDARLEDTRASLIKGSALLEIVRMVEGSRFRLDLGNYTIEAVKPGVYRFDVSPPRLRVYGGEARVESAGRLVPLKRGQEMSLDPRAARGEFDRKNDADPFHLWCAQRSYRAYRASAENRRKQTHWQRFSYNQYWNESFSVAMPPLR